MPPSCGNSIYLITLVQNNFGKFIVNFRIGKFLPALLVILPTIGFTAPQFREYLNVNIFAGELFIPFVNLVPYENLVHNFVVKHPRNWLYQKEDNPITHEVVSFMPPSKIETMHNPQVEVIVSKEDLYEPITLSNYMEQLINQHKNTRNFQSFKIINQGHTTFAQRPAQALTYTVISEGKSWKILEIATIQNLQVYLITYKAEISQYDKYQAIAHKMVRSFEISEN
jgi:PsbP